MFLISGFAELWIAFGECAGFMWSYGVRDFCKDIKLMLEAEISHSINPHESNTFIESNPKYSESRCSVISPPIIGIFMEGEGDEIKSKQASKWSGTLRIKFYLFWISGFAVLWIAFGECAGFMWIYGVRNFCKDIKLMLGAEPGWFWKITWAIIAPLFLLVILIASLWTWTNPK